MSDALTQQPDPPPQQLIIATAGHVDHGKSALVRQLTGVETDTLQAEKERGLTINLGYAYHHFTKTVAGGSRQFTLGFVDVPGHTDFIHNMLAGVGSVDFALLVVAADDGIMPQTREHLAILDLLGVNELAVAISKIDRVDDARVAQVEAELKAFLTPLQFERINFFPLSNVTGEGVLQLQQFLENRAFEAPDADAEKSDQGTRFLVDRSFSVKGIGTVITGTLRSGSIATGDQLLLADTVDDIRIRGIRLDKEVITQIYPGQRAALNVTVPHDSIQRGSWLMEASMLHPVNRFDCRITLLDPSASFRSSAQYHLYIGSSHYLVSIRCLDQAAGFFQIRSHESLHACYGDRFIIRDPAAVTTLAGGYVIDTYVPRRGRSSASRLKEITAKDHRPEFALQQLLQESTLGVDLVQFSRNYNQRLESVLRRLDASEPAPVQFPEHSHLGPRAMGQVHFNHWQNEILQQISDFHQQQPSESGISEPELSKRLNFPSTHALLSPVIDKMRADGSIFRSGTLLHLPDHQAVLSREQQEFMEKIHPLLLQAGNIPPRTRELVELTGIPLKALERILREVTKSGNLIQVAHNRHYLPETVVELASFTEQLATSKEDGAFSVIEFRDSSGIGRNLCIEILEYFDARGFTRRDGNSRLIRTEKENIFG